MFELFPVLGYCNKATMNVHVHVFVLTCALSSLGQILRNVMAGYMVGICLFKKMSNSFRKQF